MKFTQSRSYENPSSPSCGASFSSSSFPFFILKIIKYLVHDLKISFKDIKTISFQGSKKNKNINQLLKIINFLIKNKFTKKSVLISCGGGVIGDVCGLASSLYLRGMIHYHIPTTMTAIVDSCIGGKTGINYKGIINSLGNYYHADRVYVSKNIIKLIPEREYISGIPEMIKCGLINNKNIIKLLKNKKKVIERDFHYVSKLIHLSLQTKIKFYMFFNFTINNIFNINSWHIFITIL